MEDRIKAALASPGCERLADFYAVGPVQRAAVEAFVKALAPTDKEIRAAWNRTQDPIATVRAFMPAGVGTSDKNQENDCA